jgi:hypothetical protein
LLLLAHKEVTSYDGNRETEVYVEEAMTHFNLCKEAAEECGDADTHIKVLESSTVSLLWM